MALPAVVLVHGAARAGDCCRDAHCEALGGVQKISRENMIDTCHSLMVSEPERLAEILVERCRLYT